MVQNLELRIHRVSAQLQTSGERSHIKYSLECELGAVEFQIASEPEKSQPGNRFLTGNTEKTMELSLYS